MTFWPDGTPREPVPRAATNTAQDIEPDTAHHIEPDTAPDIEPDTAPDIERDTAPGTAPPAAPDGPAPVRFARLVGRRIHRAANADGADRSGLAALLTTHALQAAGDALVAVSLATTTFFSVNADAARGKIALYLLLTLLPFSLLVPVAGPLLDRFPHGRRNVLALTAGGRGLVAWTLAGSITGLALYPQALGILVLARAYGVARNAAVVRVRPPELGLVASNARLNVAATASGGLAGGIGFLVNEAAGTAWVLRLAAIAFLAAAFASLRLPSHVDDVPTDPDQRPRAWSLREASERIRRALVATVALRSVMGLLTLGLAILLKADHASPFRVGLVLSGAVGGGLLGTALASKLPSERTARLTSLALLAPIVACPIAVVTGKPVLQGIAVASVGLGASLGKYALDAALQSAVGPAQTGSAFARSETSLQLGWALGGALGLGLSLLDRTGLATDGAIAVVFAVASALPVAGLWLSRRWSQLRA